MGAARATTPRPLSPTSRCDVCGQRFRPDDSGYRTTTVTRLLDDGFYWFSTVVMYDDLCNTCIRVRRHRRRHLQP